MDTLEALAGIFGIEAGYHDIWGTYIAATPEQKRSLLAAMGVPVEDRAARTIALEALRVGRWQRPLEPVSVVAAEARPAEVAVCVPAGAPGRTLSWSLSEESGAVWEGAVAVDALPVVERRRVAGSRREMRRLALPAGLPEGYHRLEVVLEDGTASDEATLIVAPRRCRTPEDVAPGAPMWGLGCQLYSLRSGGNWGIGNFTDLARLAEMAGAAGADVIGLNPLHALFPADPGQCSPYSPSSRDFLNILYIDVEAVPDLAASDAAARLLAGPGFKTRLARARGAEMVDYETVAGLLLPVLEALFDGFCRSHSGTGSARAAAFANFRREMGPALRRFATFMALQDHFAAAGGLAMMDWRRWPAGFQQPDSPQVEDFQARHAERVEFHEYLQWLADDQLCRAAESAAGAGMRIGLYRDLAVGVGPASATAWAEGDTLLSGVAVGAPPDLLNRLGQNWGLAPLDPAVLRQSAFAPFVAALRANMRHAGALRIDHAMGLMHQYWVADGLPADRGAFVAYPFQDMLRVLALESRRRCCMVIGEDLGTVPAGFREAMAEAGILSYRVLPFERADGGRFAAPLAYPADALVTGSTHDLATLAGLWAGRDLEWRLALSLYPDDTVREADARARVEDRKRLLDALSDAGLWPAGAPMDPDVVAFDTDFMIAIQRFLARTPSRLLVVPMEDALLRTEQMNLPGTIDEHPNWRRRLTLDIEDLFRDPGFAALLAALRQERPGAAGETATGS